MNNSTKGTAASRPNIIAVAYAINPGLGNRNYWTRGVVVTRQVSAEILLGMEAGRQGSDEDLGVGSPRLSMGEIYQLRAQFRLLASAGPTFQVNGGRAGFHAFFAVGLDF